MKALGRDIKDFYDDHFPDGFYHEDNAEPFHDENCISDGSEPAWILEDNKMYDLKDCGVLVRECDGEAFSFESFFKKWIKERDTVTMIIDVPKTKLETFRLMLKDFGLKERS